jgi:hypothetical protein
MPDSSKADFKYDVYLSYRHVEPDKTWVRNDLYEKLKLAGLSVFLDAEDFAVGRSIFQEMIRGNSESRKMVCVLSPDYLEGNRMTQFEMELAAASDPAGKESRLVALILRETKVPEVLTTRVVFSWVDESEHARVWRRLLRDLDAPKDDVAAPAPVGTADRQQKRLHGHGNYLMISNESPFTRELRKLLLAGTSELGIECDPYGEEAQTFDDYKSGLFDFLEDPHPKARWLFTVHPEDEWGRMTPREEMELLEELDRTGKRIVFFESGLGFLKHDPERRKCSILVIRTDYEHAVRFLISHKVVEFLHRSNRPHLVTLLGPRSTVADERRRIYNEFLAGLQYNHGRARPSALPGSDPGLWLDSRLDLRSKALRITSLALASWYKAEAETMVLNFWDAMPNKDHGFDICFLCGNDEIALGARNAELQLRTQNPVGERRVEFIGFDGIPDMIELIGKGVEAATMRVNLKEMCKRAARAVRSPESLSTCEILVAAQGMDPRHKGQAAWGS